MIGPRTTCYDLSYGGGDTPFTRWALQQGCARAFTGWGMLVEQAADTFELWRGTRPDTQQALQVVLAAARPLRVDVPLAGRPDRANCRSIPAWAAR